MPIFAIQAYFVPLHRQLNMRRITFISPIDYMAGSLCSRQKLGYETTEGDAWSATSATISPDAYAPIIVAARRKDTGQKYFWVKGKTTTRLSADNRLSMAAFGAACAKFTALCNNANLKASLLEIYNAERRRFPFRFFIFPYLRALYANKEISCTIAHDNISVTIYNDFLYTGTVNAPIPANIKTKFINYLQ